GVYGMSKHMGEKAVLSCPHGTVIRTAWVYSDQGHNFLKTMLRVGKDRKHLKVVDDQIGTPTHASDIAQGALSLLKAQLAGKATASPGLYHYTAKGQTSWHGFAAEIFQVLKHQTSIEVKLEAISTAEYPTPATRPQFSVLDCRKIDQIEGLIRPDWQAPIEATVASVLKGEAS
ncbi:MAG: sugar nucleotide-binding protein, partial [Pseudomonadota bacterium]